MRKRRKVQVLPRGIVHIGADFRELRALGRDRNLLVVVLARLERYASRHGNGGLRAELAVLLAHGEGH